MYVLDRMGDLRAAFLHPCRWLLLWCICLVAGIRPHTQNGNEGSPWHGSSTHDKAVSSVIAPSTSAHASDPLKAMTWVWSGPWCWASHREKAGRSSCLARCAEHRQVSSRQYSGQQWDPRGWWALPAARHPALASLCLLVNWLLLSCSMEPMLLAAWGGRSQGWTCLGSLGLCAPSASLSLLQEWPQAPAWHGWARAEHWADTLPSMKAGDCQCVRSH